MASTRRSLKEAGFDDEQVQALVDMTGTGAERRALQADVAELKQGVTVLDQRIELLGERFEGLRGEIVARIEASEERVKSEVATLRGENAAFRAEIRGEFAAFRAEIRGEFAELRTEFATVHGRIDGLDGRLKLMLWFIGIGLTLYTGTTISLMILLFRDALA